MLGPGAVIPPPEGGVAMTVMGFWPASLDGRLPTGCDFGTHLAPEYRSSCRGS